MPFRNYRWIIAGSLICLLTAGLAGGWAGAAVVSLFNYRSPLHATPPAPAHPLGQPLTRRVVYVLVDALREDTSRQPEVMPYLNELRGRGAWAVMHGRPPSYSQTGYSVLLTGAWPDVSDGPAFNVDYASIPAFTQDNIFSAARRAGLKTAVSGYNWFERLIPQADVTANFYTPGEDQAADRAVVDAALPWLADGDFQLVLIHIDQVDYAGHHEGGPQGPGWQAAARRADDLLREIAATLDFSRDTLLVTSDHGQIDRGGHGGPDPVTLLDPFVLVGAGVEPVSSGDIQMVDVAPTLAVLLGANLPATSQGQPRTEMLTLSPDQAAQVEAAFGAQQVQMVNAYAGAIGEGARSANQSGLTSAQYNRLFWERAVRTPLALIAWLIPLVLFIVWRGRTLAWAAGGAFLYLVLFNLRYALLDQYAYSFSAIASPTGMALYIVGTALLALILAWIVALAGAGSFGQGARRAAEMTLALAAVTLYLLSLPVAWSLALNGLTAAWILPDFASLFLAVLSAVQMVVVGLVGLVLAGLAALVGARLKLLRLMPQTH